VLAKGGVGWIAGRISPGAPSFQDDRGRAIIEVMRGGRGFGRRRFLDLMAAFSAKMALGSVACGGEDGDAWSDPPPEPPEVPPDLFRLGVASGDPMSDRVVIWTRLAPEPLEDGGMPSDDVPVIWEVFADEQLSDRVGRGWTWAVEAWAHSVHVDVEGLEPSRTYWYRFRVGDQVSPVGRTRTFPAVDDSPERLRIALACCQKYRDGFYTAHDHLAMMELDAVVFLGDYIYESGNVSDVPGRLPIDTDRVTDLRGFRARYGGYRMDPALQAAHAAHPWIVTWDDHEVSNNYAGFHLSESRQDDGDGEQIRRAGYRAWFEHMPVRVPEFEDPAFIEIYRDLPFGDLARLVVLDTRQYRDPQPCDDEIGSPCEELLDGGRTILGERQRAWLTDVLRASRTQWNLLAQQVLFSPVLLEFELANPDQWDGYLDDRQAVLDLLADPGVRNPVVLSGDVHAAGFAELHADQYDPTTPRVALEILTTSISSGGDEADSLAQAAALFENASPSVHYVDALRRGFAVCEIRRDRGEVTYYAVSTVREPTAELYVAARFAFEPDTLDFRLLERAD
jgi:alkaline phosphatase D